LAKNINTMENTPQYHKENQDNQSSNANNNANSGQGKTVALIVLIILLVLSLAGIGYMYYQRTQDLEKQQELNVLLEDEKIELQGQLEGMINQYDSLRTNNDSINLLLEAEQAKIKRLLSINASNAAKIRLYKKEMQTLRDIMKSYIVQIDSLNQKNQMLMAENVEVKQQLQVEKKKSSELLEEKENLSTKVEKASALSAKNIRPEPLNDRSKVKDNVDKVAKIRTCFTVRENPIVAAGPVDIYLRIIRPDGVVLTPGEVEYFDYQGQQTVYSAVRTLEYENQDIEMCIYWDNDGSLVEGIYQVELYAKGDFIGESSFELTSGGLNLF